MKLSVIVPTLNEESVIAATLQRVRASDVHEIIVVDGGSLDATREVAAQFADLVLSAPQGRALQMNEGAARVTGDVLVFLHADTLLPEAFATAIVSACAAKDVVGGRFDVCLQPSSGLLALTGFLMNHRSRLTGIATGDQAIFIRRDVFEQLGGYAVLPLMEDIDLTRRMKRAGRIACLRERVTTSSRRWQEHGVLRTILLMWALRFLYCCGVPATRLHQWYRDARAVPISSPSRARR